MPRFNWGAALGGLQEGFVEGQRMNQARQELSLRQQMLKHQMDTQKFEMSEKQRKAAAEAEVKEEASPPSPSSSFLPLSLDAFFPQSTLSSLSSSSSSSAASAVSPSSFSPVTPYSPPPTPCTPPSNVVNLDQYTQITCQFTGTLTKGQRFAGNANVDYYLKETENAVGGALSHTSKITFSGAIE